MILIENCLQWLAEGSIVGIILWLFLKVANPLTRRVFSQTWQFYSSLIPIAFMAGIGRLMVPIVHLFAMQIPKNAASGGRPISQISMQIVGITSDITFKQGVEQPPFWLDKGIVLPLIFAIWLVGVIIFFAIKFKAYYCFRKEIDKTKTVIASTNNHIPIYKSDCVTTPILIGIAKPQIILPNFDMDDEQLLIILRHELVHLQRGDLAIKLAVLLINGIYWFNPMAYLVRNSLETLCENSCDEMLCRNMSPCERKFYGSTILSVVENGVAKKCKVGIGFCKTNSKKKLEGRLLNIMKIEKTKSFIVTISIAAVAVVGIVGGTIAYAIGDKPPIKPVSDNVTNSAAAPADAGKTDTTDINIDTNDVDGFDFYSVETGEKIESKDGDDRQTYRIGKGEQKITITTNDDSNDIYIMEAADGDTVNVGKISLILPLDNARVTAPAGERTVDGKSVTHRGTDFAAEYGTGIKAAADGKVTFAGVDKSYGKIVKLDHENGLETWYAQCSKLLVKEGDEVKQGDIIAEVGSTGRSTGNHLHYEILQDGKPVYLKTMQPDEAN